MTTDDARDQSFPATRPDESSARPLDPEPFGHALLTWYGQHARDLPWRGIRNPYATWLSEIMLQQTRVGTVLDRYRDFLSRFPTIAALAEAPEDDVLALWSGLGYYRRARMLHRGAQFVQRELGGELPRTAAELRTLPGVGDYTAAAIASIAFGQAVAVLDGNVERVLLRLLGLPETRSAATRSRLHQTAHDLLPPSPARRGLSNPAGDHNQAMMELGATVCLPRAPLCLQCPVLSFCRTRGEHPTQARKQLQSRRLACLLATRKRGPVTEILLYRRAREASLMPGMLDLPELPLDVVEGREPILRLRHSITNTNYYVEIFAEAAEGNLRRTSDDEQGGEGSELDAELHPARSSCDGPDPGSPLPHAEDPDAVNEDEAVYTAQPGELGRGFNLRAQLPVSEQDLRWLSAHRLDRQPLTGLARKTLQRLGLMSMQRVRVSPNRTV